MFYTVETHKFFILVPVYHGIPWSSGDHVGSMNKS